MSLVGTEGPDRLHGTDTDDTIDGLGGDDVINGRDGGDHLNGDDGDDRLFGKGGVDFLNGGAGDDILVGGTAFQERSSSGVDDLVGGAGNDRLIGGFGQDGLVGGAGADHFIFRNLSDTTADKFDRIIDFEQGSDKLVFRGEFRAGAGLHFIGQNAFSHTPGEVRYDLSNGNTAVLIDVNGDGVADNFIGFGQGEIHFTRHDFSF